MPFLDDIVDRCAVSRARRLKEAQVYRNYVFNGTGTQVKAIHNKVFAYIDQLSSSLFSSVDARFLVDFDYTRDPVMNDVAQTVARILSRDIQKTGTDQKFSEGVFWACVHGSMFHQDVWGHHGAESNLIFPYMLGAYREDIADLSRQEAFTITRFLTKGQFLRRMTDHPDRVTLIPKIMSAAAASQEGDDFRQNVLSELVFSGQGNAVATSGSNTNTGSFAMAGMSPQISAEVLAEMVRMDEVWVYDEESADYVTFQRVEDQIIEGKYRHRNLSGVKGETGITQICPAPVEGYIWGLREIDREVAIQDEFNGRADSYRRIAIRRAKPPLIATGSNITESQIKAFQDKAGFINDSSPTAKINVWMPEMPAEQEYMMREIDEWFSEAGGFTAAMLGKSVPGVRAGEHADSLTRNGSARLRNKAVNIERQFATVGDFRLKLLQAKTATTYKTEGGTSFTLGTLPDDFRVSVDSHSSSPIFSEDNKQMALTLKKLGVIDNATVVKMVHPPMEDDILDSIKKREESEQKMVQEATKSDPGFLTKLLTGKKSR